MQIKSQHIYWIGIFKILLLNIQIFRFHTGAPSPNNGFHATVKIGMFLTITNLFLIWIAQNVITSVSSYWSENIPLNILIFRCKFANASFVSGKGWIFCSAIRGKSHNYVVSLGVCGGTRRLGKRTTAIIRSPDFPNNYRQIFTKLRYFKTTKL